MSRAKEVLKGVVEARKITVMFRVSPKGLKMRDYKDLNQMVKDFDKVELLGANMHVSINGVVVGYLDINKVLDQLYGGL